MNKTGRKLIAEAFEQLETIKNALEELSGEEREKFDNLPEGIQESEKGQAIEEAADALESAVSDLDNIIDALQELT